MAAARPGAPAFAALGRETEKEIEMAEYDIKIDEYVATAMTGEEVYGATTAECEERLRDANAVYIAHCKKCQEDRDEI